MWLAKKAGLRRERRPGSRSGREDGDKVAALSSLVRGGILALFQSLLAAAAAAAPSKRYPPCGTQLHRLWASVAAKARHESSDESSDNMDPLRARVPDDREPYQG